MIRKNIFVCLRAPRPTKTLSGRMVSLLFESESETRWGVRENMVESTCSIRLWERLSERRVGDTSSRAEVGKATNSLKERSTDSTAVDEKTSRGRDRSLKKIMANIKTIRVSRIALFTSSG